MLIDLVDRQIELLNEKVAEHEKNPAKASKPSPVSGSIVLPKASASAVSSRNPRASSVDPSTCTARSEATAPPIPAAQAPKLSPVPNSSPMPLRSGVRTSPRPPSRSNHHVRLPTTLKSVHPNPDQRPPARISLPSPRQLRPRHEQARETPSAARNGAARAQAPARRGTPENDRAPCANERIDQKPPRPFTRGSRILEVVTSGFAVGNGQRTRRSQFQPPASIVQCH